MLLVAVRFGISKHGENERAKALALRSTPNVELASVEEVEMYKSIEIPGRVQSMDKVDLVARIDGYLQKKHFQEGDYVKKGQILFTIEPTQYLNNLNKAKADLENAKATLYKATRDYNRGAELVKKYFISKSTYDGLKADKEARDAQKAEANKDENQYLELDEILQDSDLYEQFATMYVEAKEQETGAAEEEKEKKVDEKNGAANA